MKVKELIERLQKFNPEMQVMISESYGLLDIGGAYANIIEQMDEDNCGDCEGRVGEEVIAISKM